MTNGVCMPKLLRLSRVTEMRYGWACDLKLKDIPEAAVTEGFRDCNWASVKQHKLVPHRFQIH